MMAVGTPITTPFSGGYPGSGIPGIGIPGIGIPDLDRIKRQFLAALNHEIRTPLSGILGMTNLLEQSNLSTEQKEYVHLTKACAEELNQVLSSALEYTSMSTGETHIDHSDFLLHEAIEAVAAHWLTRARQKGLQLRLRLSDDVPETAQGDELRLRKLLTHLLSNAVKFTETGGVRVSVRAANVIGDKVTIEIAVKDSGVGVPQSKLATIFEPFVQADTSTTRKYGGTGLGLAIVRKLLAALGGRIDVTSEPGKGSTFWVRIPVHLADGTEIRQLAAKSNTWSPPSVTSSPRLTAAMGHGQAGAGLDSHSGGPATLDLVRSTGPPSLSTSPYPEAAHGGNRDVGSCDSLWALQLSGAGAGDAGDVINEFGASLPARVLNTLRTIRVSVIDRHELTREVIRDTLITLGVPCMAYPSSSELLQSPSEGTDGSCLETPVLSPTSGRSPSSAVDELVADRHVPALDKRRSVSAYSRPGSAKTRSTIATRMHIVLADVMTVQQEMPPIELARSLSRCGLERNERVIVVALNPGARGTPSDGWRLAGCVGEVRGAIRWSNLLHTLYDAVQNPNALPSPANGSRSIRLSGTASDSYSVAGALSTASNNAFAAGFADQGGSSRRSTVCSEADFSRSSLDSRQISALKESLNEAGSAGASPSISRRSSNVAPPNPLLQGVRVLLAEDNEINRKVACAFMKSLKVGVEVAVDGREAVTRGGQHSYDIILMVSLKSFHHRHVVCEVLELYTQPMFRSLQDMMMPNLDGCAAAIELRKQGCTIPIIALTASVLQADRDRCFQSGMNDFLGKPITRVSLEALLLKWTVPRKTDRNDGPAGGDGV